MNLKKLLDSGKSFIYILKIVVVLRWSPVEPQLQYVMLHMLCHLFQQIAPYLLDSSLISYMLYLGYPSREVCLIIIIV